MKPAFLQACSIALQGPGVPRSPFFPCASASPADRQRTQKIKKFRKVTVSSFVGRRDGQNASYDRIFGGRVALRRVVSRCGPCLRFTLNRDDYSLGVDAPELISAAGSWNVRFGSLTTTSSLITGLPSGRHHDKTGAWEMHTDLSDCGIAASDDDLMDTRGDQLADDRIAPGIIRRDSHCLTRLPTVRISLKCVAMTARRN